MYLFFDNFEKKNLKNFLKILKILKIFKFFVFRLIFFWISQMRYFYLQCLREGPSYSSFCLCSGGNLNGNSLDLACPYPRNASSTPLVNSELRQKPSPSICFVILFPFFRSSMRKQFEGSKFFVLVL